MKRLAIFLAAAFVISWGAGWILAGTIPPDGGPSTSRLFMALYLLGGFGPTFAVAATARAGGAADDLNRLLRWRVSPIWWPRPT